MEASEKPQLPLEKTSGDGTVRVLEDRIVVESLTIADRDTARVVRERAETGQPPAETLTKAIEIGARVLEREGTAAEVDYVKAEFGKHTAELAEKLSKALEGGSEQLAEEIARTFGADRQGTVQHQIKEMLVRFAEHQRDSLARQFSASDGTNPLADFKSAMVREVRDLKAQHEREREADRSQIKALGEKVLTLSERLSAEERVEAEQERGTAKGRTFEERVHAAIELIAEARGDVAHHVGDELADGGGKKGDTVVELGAATAAGCERIVFEAKDRKRISKNKAWEELNGAMAKRGASFAVLVVAGEEAVPAGREQLTEYEGNKMIIAVDRDVPDVLALRLAYSLAVARLAMRQRPEGEIDVAAVRDAAEEARSALKGAQKVKLALTGASDGVEKARLGLEEMVAAVIEPLARLDAIVEASAEKP
jgi:hypothetical protein